jgi:hypothetical protein
MWPNEGMTLTLVLLADGSQGAAMGNSPFISKLRRIFDWLKTTIDKGGSSYDPGQTGPGDTSHLGHGHGGHGHGGHGHGGGGHGGGGHGGGGFGGGGHGH